MLVHIGVSIQVFLMYHCTLLVGKSLKAPADEDIFQQRVSPRPLRFELARVRTALMVRSREVPQRPGSAQTPGCQRTSWLKTPIQQLLSLLCPARLKSC